MAEDVKVPEGWRRVRLGEILSFRNGKSPQIVNGGTYPIYGSNGLIGFTNDYFLDGVFLLVGRVGASGETHLVSGKVWASDNCLIGECKSDTTPVFIYYLLKYLDLKKFITQTAQPLITQSFVNNLQIILPPLPEQHKIAEILETIDNAIEKTGRIIEKYKRIKQGLMQDLLTRGIAESDELGVRSYELRDEKKHRFKNSPLGRIPEEWEVVELGEVFKLKSGMTRPCDTSESGNYPIYGGNGILGYTNEKNFDIETIIIGRVGEYCGVVYIASGGWVTDNALYVVVKKRDYNNLFLCYLLNYVNLNQYSAETGQPLMTQSIVYKIQIPLPPLPEQKRIASILFQIDEAIEKEKKYKEKLERIKRGLMEDLLTGKVRVNELIDGGKNIDKQN